MARYFAPITKDELKQKIDALHPTEDEDEDGYRDYRVIKWLTPDIEKDLSKVEFDTENVMMTTKDMNHDCKLIGDYQTLDNGLTYLGVVAGGDWERPIFFIIYWDGKKLRGYIPKDGNVWNYTTKQAYGNDGPADFKDACKYRLTKKQAKELENSGDVDDYFSADFDLDQNKIIEDIKSRILPKP